MEAIDAIEEIFLGPKIQGDSREIRMRFKRIYLEHVQRRPILLEQMKEVAGAAHQHWLNLAQIAKKDPRQRLPQRFLPTITPEEKKIIDIPIDILMRGYEKHLIRR